jgi:HAD superfamily hydrolase (TIGR01509 family)
MIKAVIFDFFSVLAIRDSEPFKRAYFPDDIEKNKQNQEALEQLGRGLIGYDEFIDKLAELGGVGRETVLKYTEDYHPNEELLGYIRAELKPKYKIGIISNAGQDWVLRILGKDNLELFDDVTLSYKVGMIKPEPEIYKISARNLGVEPTEAVFVDDILSYCRGAESVGMKSIWYRDFGQTREDLEKILAAVSDN